MKPWLRWTLGIAALAGLVGVGIRVGPGLAAPRHEGRPIAEVMGWQGHPWLEREGREAEEDPARLIELLRVKPGQTVLDLGCGSGYHARRLSRVVGPKGEVLCVDLQPEMLTIAQQHAEEAGLSNIRFVRGSTDGIPVRTGSVDVALMVDVYHELSEPVAMLRDLRRVLAADGRAAVAEFRLEGDSAEHIARDHRMAKAQVELEWTKLGFALARFEDSLPTQHLFVFRRSAEPSAEGRPPPK